MWRDIGLNYRNFINGKKSVIGTMFGNVKD